jgi:hypothetical protein
MSQEKPPQLPADNPDALRRKTHNRHWAHQTETWDYSQLPNHSAFHSMRGQAMLVVQPQNPDSQANGTFVSRSVVSGEIKNVTITPGAGEVKLQGQSIRMSLGTVGVVITPTPRIARPPAGRLIRVLGRVLTRAAFEGMVGPFIAQEQHEYYEALLRGELGQAKWIVLRMYLLIGYNLFAAVAASLIRLVRRAG